MMRLPHEVINVVLRLNGACSLENCCNSVEVTWKVSVGLVSTWRWPKPLTFQPSPITMYPMYEDGVATNGVELSVVIHSLPCTEYALVISDTGLRDALVSMWSTRFGVVSSPLNSPRLSSCSRILAQIIAPTEHAGDNPFGMATDIASSVRRASHLLR